MIINIMTLFPAMFNDFKRESLIGKAIEKKLLEINVFNIRDFTKQRANSVDDEVYGGGNGMLMMAQPIYDCYKKIMEGKSNIKTYYMSPKGKTFNQEMAIKMSKETEINILCGHYEGVDERALQLINTEEISIGDYVLTGGELPAMVVIDSVARFVKGVLSNDESTSEESFMNNLLEYPQFTRPYEYEGLKVPDILLSGDHKKVSEWKLEQAIEITKKNRPDLYEKYLKDKI
ncbi:MAG: tRNA (guanosine(37)-N1)-methyltransferase TrmD [Lachnospiraceae bacterium]|nr:tRNA (guanosine(37)-N1)-methyltransferase TrmD [Lachnospiraceae bacterium]